ncbi:oxygenase MpaB family protein [Arthrobacter tecti]
MVRGLADIGAEGVLLAGAGRAILLQLANPPIGRGIAAHSDFAARPLDRLRGTMTYVYAIVYGTEAQRAEVRRRVNRAHAPVRTAAIGGTPGYSAYDPDLQLWVVATLYDTAVTVHERVYGPLDEDAADLVYSDYAAIGTALQLPADLWPPNRSAFEDYFRAGLTGLSVDPSARKLAQDLLHPVSGPRWLRLCMPLARFLTAGLLPPGVREEFRFEWSSRHDRCFDLLMRMTAVVYPRLPERMRHGFRNYCLRRLDPKATA